MDNIYSAFSAFQILLNYSYDFIVAHQKSTSTIRLTFQETDFYHLAGFHYLKDIELPKNAETLFRKIGACAISDVYLKKSRFYTTVEESYANVQQRICGIQTLEQYLDSKNLICKYVKYMNKYSLIDADYLIKSTVVQKTAYIFLRKRKREETYCICSFFINPRQSYEGIKAYWLYKAKINNCTKETLILYDRLHTQP